MTIAIIGTGLMGTATARRLHQQGEAVIAWNRHAATARERLGPGITVVERIDDAVQTADTLLLFLADAGAIAEVLLPLPPEALVSKSIVQMGTIAPSESRDLSRRFTTAGADYLEAPVLGSLPEAAAGTLLLMVGATPALFERHEPLLSRLGKARRIGPVGKAAAVKLAMNQLIAGLTASFALSLNFVMAEEVDVAQFMEILRDSALYAPTFDKKLGKMLASDYDNPNFPLKHLDKDVKLFLRAAAEHALNTALLEGVESVLADALAAGRGEQDYSALRESI